MRIESTIAVTLLIASTLSFACLPASAGEPNLVEVPLDVDVYDHPGGEGKPRGEFLKGHSHVDLLREEDHWCHVASAEDPVPGGSGFIWCGKGEDGKDYSVTKVTASMPDPTGGSDTQPEPSGDTGAGGGGGD